MPVTITQNGSKVTVESLDKEVSVRGSQTNKFTKMYLRNKGATPLDPNDLGSFYLINRDNILTVVESDGTESTIISGGQIGTDIQPYNANTTIQGNYFNGTLQLVKTDASGRLPAIDGSLLLNLPSGFADPMFAIGDMIYRNNSNLTARLPLGTNGQVLTVVGGNMAWATSPAGVTDHTLLTNIGSNTHAQIDTHISSETAHNISNSTLTLTNKTLKDYTNVIHADSLHYRVKNVDVVTLTKATPVRFSGYNSGENAIEVVRADQSTHVSIGLVESSIGVGSFGQIVIAGTIENMDTSTYSAGAILFVDGTGALTATEPNTGYSQPIAFVVRNHAINGAIQVLAAYPKQSASDVRYNSTSTVYDQINTANGANELVRLDGTGRLPAVDGSQLTNLPSGSSTLSGLTDTTITTPLDGQSLNYDTATGKWVNSTPTTGVTDHTLLTNIGTNTHTQIDTHIADSTIHLDATAVSAIADVPWIDIDRLGMLSQTEATLSFDDTTYTFTLTDAGSGWSYYRNGLKYSFTGNKSVVLSGSPPADGHWFIYIDSNDGTLIASQTEWSLLDDKVSVGSVFLNKTATPKYWLADERYSALLDKRMHYIIHATVGTSLVSAPTITGYTVSGSLDTDNTVAISSSAMMDQDILHNLSLLADGDGTTPHYVIFHRTSPTTWTWKHSEVPFDYTPAGYINWDNNGTHTQGANNKYYNTYLLMTNLTGDARYSFVCGRGEFANLAEAQTESIESFTWDGFEIDESVICYRLTWATASNLSTKGKVNLATAPQSIQLSTVTNTSSGAGVSHNTLSSLQGGTVDEYYHLTLAELTKLTNLGDTLASLTDTVITTPSDGQVLTYNTGTSKWINSTPVTDHTLLTNIGTNTHAQIDTHIADTTVHFTQASISITESQISDLQAYLTSETSHADVLVDGDFATAGFMKTNGAGVYSVDANTYSLSSHNHNGVYEPVLGNPSTDGYILSSTAAGTRSWVAPSGGGGSGVSISSATLHFLTNK